MFYYELIDHYVDNYPFYMPEDLLSYAEPVLSEEEAAYKEFIENLEVTADTYKPRYGHECANENKGKRLKDFSFMTEDDKYMLEYYKNRPAHQADILKDFEGTEAEKLWRRFRKFDSIGHISVPMIYKYLVEGIEEIGVELTELEMAELLGKFAAAHNNSHLWCLFGWTPNGLREAFGGTYPTDEVDDDTLDAFMDWDDIEDDSEDDIFDDDWIPIEADKEDETDLQRRMRERGLRLID